MLESFTDRILPSLGRAAYAAMLLGLGALCLGYRDFVWALQPVPGAVPGRLPLAILTGLALLALGLAIAAERTAVASRVLIAILASWIVLLQLPIIVLDPAQLRGSGWWVRTFETVALIGGAMMLAGVTSASARQRWLRPGRILFGVGLPVFGVLHFIRPAGVAQLVPPWFGTPLFWAYFTGCAMVAAGLAIVSGVWWRWAATLAGLMYGLFVVSLHVPRAWCGVVGGCESLPQVVGLAGSRAPLTSIFVVTGVCAAAWLVAAHGEPRPRARSAATEVAPPAAREA